MPRKKSRPTHRENAAAVPSNEGGFYKMFWNSMDTNPGTNGPNSPSQEEGSVTSPVIIINDSPADSPCAGDENSCENVVVPLPIKEETRDDSVENSNQPPSGKTYPENLLGSHSGINGDCSSLQTCLPGNPMTSRSKNSSHSPCFPVDLISSENPTPKCGTSSVVSTCVVSNESRDTPNDCNTVNCVPPDQIQEKPARAEESGVQLVEDIQVCDRLPAEEHGMFSESNSCHVVNSNDVSDEVVTSSDVNPNQSINVDADSSNTPHPNGVISVAPSLGEVIAAVTPVEDQECLASIPEAHSVLGISARACNTMDGSSLETVMELTEETAIGVVSVPQSPQASQINDDENTREPPPSEISVGNEPDTEEPPLNQISRPPSPALSEGVGRTLSLLQSLLNAPDEDLEDFNEAFSELPALIGQPLNAAEQNGEDMIEFEPTHESSFCSHGDISNIDGDQSTDTPKNVHGDKEDGARDNTVKNNTDNDMMVDEEEEKFPIFSNFLPKKIKVDSVGILRSVKLIKDSVRALYKEYLKDDVILRTASTPEPPVEANESADEIEETPASPLINVYPICCVKMERLPDPFVDKSTVTMSDVTFKTWKKQIIQQRNEEKFRNLKVWRRGRTLLWRECELAGMDRATYDEQVAYVKKHRINENSSSDGDSSEDDCGHDAHQCDSSEESSSDEEHQGSELIKQKNSENQPIPSSPMRGPETSADIHSPEDEYIVERTSQSPTTKAPSALKITIRKTSLSKSEDDKEKSVDEEEHFPVPAKPTKSRKVATKRTFRRPSDPVPKANAPPKSVAADPKKSKSSLVDNEDLYDQSLLGTRSHEVENFNLLEKWDIPFEEPTLFRSPRAASRLAQLKTKEAFAPTLKRHAPPKTTNTTTTSTATTTASSTNTVTREVKEVVDWLCSKTVEAILFPESRSPGPNELKDKDASKSNVQPVEVTSKPLVPGEETSSILDESSEAYQSETNSTLDASSDFGGSTASLASEESVPPKDTSPQKSRRRRRVGPAWHKKKKGKGKTSIEQPEGKESVSKNDVSSSPIRATEQVEKIILPHSKRGAIQENCKSNASPTHSTQVPVVSEGPGQSPHESEDDSTQKSKHPTCQSESNRKLDESTVKKRPSTVTKASETPLEESQSNREVQEEAIQPRLTRSKKPTIELEPGLLENFGTRKRKPKTDVGEVCGDGDTKKPKQGVTKGTDQKQLSNSLSNKVSEGLCSMTDGFAKDNLNTQVPEVSEGPGEVELHHENKRGQGKKVETQEPLARMLRSRSRGPRPSTPAANDPGNHQNTDEPAQVGELKPASETQPEETLVLESPQSPPPEPDETEPLINSRITRSKKRRSGPAYVAVKSTNIGDLPSVCDVVDSIAGHRLPIPSKLFDGSAASLTHEPVTMCTLQTLNVCDTALIATSSSSELIHKPKFVDSVARESIQHTAIHEGPSLDSKLDDSTLLKDSDTIVELKAQVIEKTPADIAGQDNVFANKSVTAGTTSLPAAPTQPAIEGGLATSAVMETDFQGSGKSSPGLALEKPISESTVIGRLDVLDTLNNILAVSSPAKSRHPVSTVSPVLPSLSSDKNQPVLPPVIVPASQPPVSSLLATPTASSTSVATFPTSTPDLNSILPGTFLNSLISSTLDDNFTTYNNAMSDSTSLPDDPDGDLVIDEGEAPEADARIDVNFWENLTNADLSDTNADFSDDDNNTDLSDKIDKIIKEQIHQDPVPVPSVNHRETIASSNDGKKQALGGTSPSKNETEKCAALNRRDSIDERTGLPNNLIQRLRDPRIRSRLLCHLEEAETNDKSPQPTLLSLQNSLPANNVTSSTGGDPQAAKITCDPRKIVDSGVSVHTVGTPVSTAVSSCHTSTAAMEAQLNVKVPAQLTPLAVPNMPGLVSAASSQPTLAAEGAPVEPVQNSGNPEEPPDPSQVDFLVPPSDDEEEDSIKRRPPKKAKKEVDVELMYKSPLEDLQSEARPAYGDRAARRYADKYRRNGDDRQPRWDDRRSRIDDTRGPREGKFDDPGRSQSRDWKFDDRGRSKSKDRRFEDRGRSKSRDRRFDDPGRGQSRDRRFDRGRSPSRDRRFDDRGRDRSKSRDRRSYYDCLPRDQSRDRRASDPYHRTEEHEINPHHMDMQVPYNQPHPTFNHHQTAMRRPVQSPHWQPNYYQEPRGPPHPPIFMPEPPKIDYMETRLINLELLPKTTNLEVTPVKKVYSYFDKDSLQIFRTPPPTYDPKDEPHTIKMVDPESKEMVDFIQTPRPTSGLTKEYFRHVPPDLSLDDVVRFHFISPAYVMVQDNEGDTSSSSDEEKDELDAKQKIQMHHRRSALEHKKRLSRPLVEHNQKRSRESLSEDPLKRENECMPGDHVKLESSCVAGNELLDDPLQNILQNLPLLKEQYSLQKSNLPMPPPPPEWNDVDLRISRALAAGGKESPLTIRSPSPPKERPLARSRSRSKSPCRPRRSRSPRRRRRSRSRSFSLESDMSISPSKSGSRSPSYSRARVSRRCRSRSRSSGHYRSRRSHSPKRRSTSVSPSRKHSRR